MMPRGFRKDTRTVEGRDDKGRRTKRIFKRDQDHGGRWGGYEHYHHDTTNDAHIKPVTVTVTLSAREFGMTQAELARVMAGVKLLNPPPRRTASGLHLP